MTERQRWYQAMCEEFTPVDERGDLVNVFDVQVSAERAARLAAHFGRLASLQTYLGDVPDNAPLAFVEDCLQWRGRVLEGDYRHWCAEWDDLPMDETCPEWPCHCAAMNARFAAKVVDADLPSAADVLGILKDR